MTDRDNRDRVVVATKVGGGRGAVRNLRAETIERPGGEAVESERAAAARAYLDEGGAVVLATHRPLIAGSCVTVGRLLVGAVIPSDGSPRPPARPPNVRWSQGGVGATLRTMLAAAHPRSKPALPDGIRACLFDMDGVLTETATVHAAAWKETFDDYLRRRAARAGGPFGPFDAVADYDEYVDGKPRVDGVRSLLASRGITLPEGSPADPPSAETVDGLGNPKNETVLRLIREQGVKAYPGSVRFLHAFRGAGLRTAVVSSSVNCREVLEAAGIADLFDVRVDGATIERDHLDGKPAPDGFLAAARELGVAPAAGAVFEDALAGVAAGRAGRFGCVVGVDRAGQAVALRRHGADVVVADLADLLTPS